MTLSQADARQVRDLYATVTVEALRLVAEYVADDIREGTPRRRERELLVKLREVIEPAVDRGVEMLRDQARDSARQGKADADADVRAAGGQPPGRDRDPAWLESVVGAATGEAVGLLRQSFDRLYQQAMIEYRRGVRSQTIEGAQERLRQFADTGPAAETSSGRPMEASSYNELIHSDSARKAMAFAFGTELDVVEGLPPGGRQPEATPGGGGRRGLFAAEPVQPEPTVPVAPGARAIPGGLDPMTRAARAGAAALAEAERATIDTDLVQFNSVGDPCPLCEPWEGRTLSRSGRHPDYPALQEAYSAGVGHPNCRHTPRLVRGARPSGRQRRRRVRDREREARMRLRAIERRIRLWKRRQSVAVTERYAAETSKQVRKWQAEARRHVEETEAQRRYWRER